MRSVKCIMISLFVLLICSVQGQNTKDKERFEEYISVMEGYDDLSWEDILVYSAIYFLETPYVVATLEQEPEQLIINLQELDCTTFVENVLALSRTFKSGDRTWNRFLRELQSIRYRDGLIGGYTSRLHYATEWILNNEEKGIVKDLGEDIGGVAQKPALSFMSSHPDAYKQLKNDPALQQQIRIIEERINRETSYYIPKERIAALTGQMQNGDIVFFTTSIEGLDVTHMGFIYQFDGKTSFIHASSAAKKVIIDPNTLEEYVKKGKSATGILLARPLPPSP